MQRTYSDMTEGGFTPAMAQLERQNELLWRQNRWLKRLVGGSVICAAAFGWLAIAKPLEAQTKDVKTVKTVTAERFVLVDKNGKRRAVLGQDAVYGLTLSDEDGNPHLVVYANKEIGRGVCLFQDTFDGKKQVGMLMLPDGSSAVDFRDANARPRLALGAQPDGKAGVVIQDESGKIVFAKSE